MRYTVSKNKNRQFEIIDENNHSTGNLEPNTWWPAKARINTADSDIYEIKPIGFWQTRRSLTRNGIPFGELKFKAGSGFTITLEGGSSYYIRKKSFWRNRDFILTDSGDNIIGTVNTWFGWKPYGHQYEIELNTAMIARDTMYILPFLMLYSVRQVQQAHAAVV